MRVSRVCGLVCIAMYPRRFQVELKFKISTKCNVDCWKISEMYYTGTSCDNDTEFTNNMSFGITIIVREQ